MLELLCISSPTNDDFTVKSITKVLDLPLTSFNGVMCRKNQMLYMAPGAASNGSVRSEWYGFDTDNDILTTLKSSNYAYCAAHAALVGEHIYLTGGTRRPDGNPDNSGNGQTMWYYNPETDTWTGMRADEGYTLSVVNDFTFEYEGFLHLHLEGRIYRSTRPDGGRRAWMVYAEPGQDFYANAGICHYLDGDDLYMFGGRVGGVDKRIGKFNLITKTWVDVTDDYDFFSFYPSHNTRAAVFKFRNSFIFIPDLVGTAINNRNIYKLTKGKAPEIIGWLPIFARGASFEMVGNHIYMYGGVGSSTGTHAHSRKELHRIELG